MFSDWKRRYAGKPAEKPAQKEVGWSPSCDRVVEQGYAIIHSEIGPIFCYDNGSGEYEEFFTGLDCHPQGFTLVFDYCGTGFRAVEERASGNDLFAKEEVTKQEFALAIDNYISKYGSKERAKADLERKIRERIAYRDENLRKWEQEKQEEAARQKRLDYQSNQAINRYGIR